MRTKKEFLLVLSLLLVFSMLFSACSPATGTIVEDPVDVEEADPVDEPEPEDDPEEVDEPEPEPEPEEPMAASEETLDEVFANFLAA